ncbi:hypothetical protein AB0I35_23910 [Nocardia sp. NPDC050378]|uniref:hypothetical protein n=1 Tax=Nocardia sp. NPDC050378 TaxID=3155400 RepID=UPI0033F944BD
MSALDAAATAGRPETRSFEDFRVGEVSTIELSPEGGLTRTRLLSVLGQAAPFRDALMTQVRWELGARPDAAGTRIEGIVTRWKPERKRGRGTLHQDVRLLDADGAVVERAHIGWDVPAATQVEDDLSPSRIAWDVGTVAWGEHLAARLANNADFVSAVQTFDGSIAIRAGEAQVEFRIYRGAVLEVARKTLDGPTFTIGGGERAWVELLAAADNDFVSRTRRGEFRSVGNNFQYLRLFRAVMLMIDEAQLAAVKEMPGA